MKATDVNVKNCTIQNIGGTGILITVEPSWGESTVARDINIEKGNKTAYDYVREKYGEVGIERYLRAIDDLNISKSKKRNLLTSEVDIPKDFIERDLRDTQYIAKKSRELLLELVPFVVSTTGSITDRLREDWQLINVLQELNWDKYDRQGLTDAHTSGICKDGLGEELTACGTGMAPDDGRYDARRVLT